jgi:hypothetical protein
MAAQRPMIDASAARNWFYRGAAQRKRFCGSIHGGCQNCPDAMKCVGWSLSPPLTVAGDGWTRRLQIRVSIDPLDLLRITEAGDAAENEARPCAERRPQTTTASFTVCVSSNGFRHQPAQPQADPETTPLSICVNTVLEGAVHYRPFGLKTAPEADPCQGWKFRTETP